MVVHLLALGSVALAHLAGVVHRPLLRHRGPAWKAQLVQRQALAQGPGAWDLE